MRRQLQESIASDCLLDHSEVAGIAARQNRAWSEIARIRAETGIQSEVAVRRIEARMVEDIECIRLEFERHALRYLEILHDRKIKAHLEGSAEGIAAGWPEASF